MLAILLPPHPLSTEVLGRKFFKEEFVYWWVQSGDIRMIRITRADKTRF